MKNYTITLRKDFKTNEVAKGLAFVAVIFTVVFGGLVIGNAFLTGTVSFGNALALPALFWGIATAHFLIRPAVLLGYSKK